MVNKLRKLNSRRLLKKSYITLKKVWDNYKNNFKKAERFLSDHSRTRRRQWYIGFMEFLYKRIIWKNAIDEMQTKKAKALKQSMLTYISTKTKKNLNKRRNEHKANSFKLINLSSKSFVILKRYSLKMIKLAINLKQYHIDIRSKIFYRWLKEIKYLNLIATYHKELNQVTKKRFFNEFKHHVLIKKILTSLFELTRKSRLFQVFSLIRIYSIAKNKENQEIIQLDSYRRRLYKQIYWKKWVKFIKNKHVIRDLIMNNEAKRIFKMKKLFFEILDIKRHKHKLRDTIIKKFQQNWDTRRIELYFISFLGLTIRIKKKRQAYKLVYINYKLSQKRLVLDLLKENVIERKIFEKSLLPKINILKKRKLRVFFEKMFAYTKKIKLENSKIRMLMNNSKHSLLQHYFAQ